MWTVAVVAVATGASRVFTNDSNTFINDIAIFGTLWHNQLRSQPESAPDLPVFETSPRFNIFSSKCWYW